jgi:hypothetical protein
MRLIVVKDVLVFITHLGFIQTHHHSLTLKHNPKVLIFTCYVNGPSTLNTCEGFYTLEILVFNNVVRSLRSTMLLQPMFHLHTKLQHELPPHHTWCQWSL